MGVKEAYATFKMAKGIIDIMIGYPNADHDEKLVQAAKSEVLELVIQVLEHECPEVKEVMSD